MDARIVHEPASESQTSAPGSSLVPGPRVLKVMFMMLGETAAEKEMPREGGKTIVRRQADGYQLEVQDGVNRLIFDFNQHGQMTGASHRVEKADTAPRAYRSPNHFVLGRVLDSLEGDLTKLEGGKR